MSGNSTTNGLNGNSEMQQILNEIMNNSTALISGNLTNNASTTPTYLFCNAFVSEVNVVGSANCTYSNVSTNTPNFTTSNGMAWYGFDQDFSSGLANIWVDVNGKNYGVNSI